MLEQRRDKVERELEAKPRRFLRVGVAAQQHLEPARAPLQLAHRGAHLRVGARLELEAHDAAQLAVELHG